MRHGLLNGVALAVAAISMQGAQAAINGPSALSTIYWPSFSVTITDLDLSDGVTPSFTFANQTGYVEAYAQSPADNQWVFKPLSASDWATGLSSSASTTHAEASALSNSVIHQAIATAEQSVGMCWYGGPCTGLNQVNRGAAYTRRYADFTFTGVGEAVITMDWSLATSDATPGDAQEFAFASVHVTGFYKYSNNSPGGWAGVYKELDTRSGPAGTLSDTWMLTVSNPTNALWAKGYLELETYANAEGYINPVPEPETWAMLLAGIGLVGLIARRRSQR